jgi:hypothetical protein
MTRICTMHTTSALLEATIRQRESSVLHFSASLAMRPYDLVILPREGPIVAYQFTQQMHHKGLPQSANTLHRASSGMTDWAMTVRVKVVPLISVHEPMGTCAT